MPKTIAPVLVAMMLSAGFQLCFGQGRGNGGNVGNGPRLSIMTTNQSVMLTWSQTPTNWVLIESPALNAASYWSNGVVYIEAQRTTIIPSSDYGTNGTNYFVVLPMDYSANKFYTMQTNDFTLPPPPQLAP